MKRMQFIVSLCLCSYSPLGVWPAATPVHAGTLVARTEPAGSPAPTPAGSEARHPWLAGLASLVPGGGQLYNRHWTLGGIIMTADVGIYLAAAASAGLLDPHSAADFTWDASFLLTLAVGIHLASAFDAVFDAQRHNENLSKWSLALTPGPAGWAVSYGLRF